MIFSSSSKTRFYMVIFLVFLGMLTSLYSRENTSKTESDAIPPSPWMKPRQLSSFQSLLQHSPFSLATAEESSPLAERYAVTGIITLDGEEEIFVLDKNDQSRELLTKKPNKKSMSLVNIMKETDPNKLKATILVNGETGVITSPELNTNAPTMGPQRFNGPGVLNSGNNLQKNTFHPSGAPYYPGQTLPNAPHAPGTMPNTNNPNNHRVITRPPISGQPMQGPNNFYQ
ncbi:MAG: hypothetical protein ACOYK6_02340 [Chthoniobacterales bacterium]